MKVRELRKRGFIAARAFNPHNSKDLVHLTVTSEEFDKHLHYGAVVLHGVTMHITHFILRHEYTRYHRPWEAFGHFDDGVLFCANVNDPLEYNV
ncbi:MAG: hypothetical protein J6Y02_20200 [Pseudobutyrivibrio sp.]|nr:hypothetical protein [Pseudobutyrivibrio sp.]